jgi:hypothetical protein
MSDQTEPDLQPDIGEVLQEEPDYKAPPIGVAVCGPVRTQALPRKGGSTRTLALSSDTVVHILRPDHRRAAAVLVSHTADFLIAYSEASSTHESTMARIPMGTLFTVTATVDVYVRCVGDEENPETTTLSVIQERWAEGD